MEGQLQNSSKSGYCINNDDTKYASRLSAILVATIQDAKEQISQIEYIFCNQLYPKFQSNTKSMQIIYAEARKAVEDEWKEKESDLIGELEKVRFKKQQLVEQNQLLLCEKEQLSKEHEEKMKLVLAKLDSHQLKITELEQELKQKSKEVDEGLELHNQLLQLVQRDSPMLRNGDTRIKGHGRNASRLLAEVNQLKEKSDQLQEELTRKIEEVASGKQLAGNLLNKIECLSAEIMNNEKQLMDHQNERKLSLAKVGELEEKLCGLQNELRKRIEEVEEGKELQAQLLKQIDLNGSKCIMYEQQLGVKVEEEKLLLAKIRELEETVSKLQLKCRKVGREAEGKESHDKLLEQLELMKSKLQSEEKGRREAVEAYKRLKSQYNYLLEKCGLTSENMLQQYKLEGENDSLRHSGNPKTHCEPERKNSHSPAIARDIKEVKKEIKFEADDDEKGFKSIKPPMSRSPQASFLGGKRSPASAKSAPIAGTKRPASSWRETRSRPWQAGPDPHDDFLDTPFEHIRENLNKASIEEASNKRRSVNVGVSIDDSDDETQDPNVNPCEKKQQASVQAAGQKGFKYVEPVRKKADREKLKGVECKQCKKFYDAVLPENGEKDVDGDKQRLRCEHHDGVSRHRYRYEPPLTPEGFWNIGFESET